MNKIHFQNEELSKRKVLGIIPARMAATRFPNKPMQLIKNIPMIGHCYYRSKLCELLDEVYVATCDIEIFDYIKSIGGNVVMTSKLHERPTERSAEALLIIEKISSDTNFDIIVMIQGDEPLIDPKMINQVIEPIIFEDNAVSNLMLPFVSIDDVANPNHVKVVTSIDGKALYMSREVIPSAAKYDQTINYYKQIGLMAFTREALINFIQLPPSSLEIIESIDMNRFIQNKIQIQMRITNFEPVAVDTKEDLKIVEEKMEIDLLFPLYRN
jgi:3-deoxy-manno-octulosonate cytidylyltransferase (CMP-KDO synthetase)